MLECLFSIVLLSTPVTIKVIEDPCTLHIAQPECTQCYSVSFGLIAFHTGHNQSKVIEDIAQSRCTKCCSVSFQLNCTPFQSSHNQSNARLMLNQGAPMMMQCCFWIVPFPFHIGQKKSSTRRTMHSRDVPVEAQLLF